jgi:hypothetical protein
MVWPIRDSAHLPTEVVLADAHESRLHLLLQRSASSFVIRHEAGHSQQSGVAGQVEGKQFF